MRQVSGSDVVVTRDRAGFVSVEGARLGYRIEGEGEPLLVVGSAVCYPRIFSPQLRERLRLVFVDLRHFAASDGSVPVDQISIDTYADDIEHVRRTLGLGDVLVLGHSIHGCIALEYARRYPEHVRGVVSTGSYPHLSDEEPDPTQRMWDEEATDERKQLLARNKAALTPEFLDGLSPAERSVRSYVARGPTYWFDPTTDATWLWDGVDINIPVYDQLGELFDHSYDLAQGPGEITVPVLIAQGRSDFNAPYTAWEEHRHKLARHTFALFERSGHFPSLEEPERFDETLLEWVSTLAET